MSDIQLALEQIKKNQRIYQRYVDYYEGNHKMAFATEKFINTFGNTLKEMRENLCPIVVDAPADRMEVINFSGGDSGQDAVAEKAWEIWQREMMELYSSDVHKEAFKCSDAYVIVWASEDNQAVFYPQDSRNCAVIYDESTGKALFAAKCWKEGKRIRLTLYYADRIEWFITRESYNVDSNDLKEESFEVYASEKENESMSNPYGAIPMFHFKTEPVLANAIPVQDRLNKTICDELVAQEFGAYPQRYATGLEPPTNEMTGEKELPFKAGIDRLWFTGDAETKFGQFASTDLKQFLDVEDAARLAVARVTGTPLHFFSFTMSNVISGEALKTLESRFTKRVKRTCLAFGAVWSRAMSFALQIEGITPQVLTTQWTPAEQRSEREILETLILKQSIGVPDEVLCEEYGYTEEDLARFRTLNAQKTDALSNTIAKSFNRGIAE